MCRPSMANGRLVASAASGQPALAEVVSMQHAGDHAVAARQAQIGLQPLGQPRAPGPDADQCGIGWQQLSHALAQLGVQGFGIKLQHRHRPSAAYGFAGTGRG
jgi:hypothetical protein